MAEPAGRRRAAGLAFRALGAALVLAPFVPVERIFGEMPGLSALVPPEEWLLGLAIFGAAGWVAALLAGGRIEAAGRRIAAALESDRGWGWGPPLALLGFLLAASWWVFRHRPLLVDSVAQLFQAKILAAGAWTAPAPADPAFFATMHMVVDGGRWYSQYPPGHSALLAAGVAAGAAWVVPVALSVGALLFLRAFAREAWDARTANLTAALLVLCPFFWFMGASFMSHVSTLFFVAAFLWAFARWEGAGGGLRLTLAAAALGGAFLSRPVTALAVGLPFVGFTLAVARRERRWRDLVPAAAAFLAVAALFPAWSAVTTGDPWTPGYIRLWGASHGLGFHATPWGELHTPLTGLRNELIDLALLAVFLFEWPIPALLPVGLLFAAGLGTGRWERRLLLAFLAVPAMYFFYWHRDAFLGPRFLYSGAVACLVPLTARALDGGLRRLAAVGVGRPGGIRPVRAGDWAGAVVGLAFLYALGWGIPQRFAIYATGLASMKVDVLAEARDRDLEPGIVFVKTAWGDRILAELHGLGVPAPVAERVYRRSDHCDLHRIAVRARREGWPAARTTTAVEATVLPPDSLVAPTGLNGDPTLRLRRGPVPPACEAELRYDADGGYTVYVAHLAANRVDLGGPWIVARDLLDRNRELRVGSTGPAYVFTGSAFRRLPDDERAGRRPADAP